MKTLLSIAHGIDRVTDVFGAVAKWAVLASCLISAGNALIRYIINNSSNGWLEIQWYLFAACVMLGAAQVLRVNEHSGSTCFTGACPRARRCWSTCSAWCSCCCW